MPTLIVPLPPAAAPAAGRVLASALTADPGWSALVPDQARRVAALRTVCTTAVREALRNGVVDAAVTADGDLAGVVVWLAPGRFPLGPAGKARAVPALLRLFLRHPKLARPVAGLGAAVERAFPGDEPWYLEILGVDPAHQGGGLGTRLLGGVLTRADREARACYLETSRPANIGFYERLGFTAEREAVLVPGGVPFTLMRRPPARSRAAG